jgi:phenylalanyl-tRNA synthetase beta chain
MILSHQWLSDYVELPESVDELVDRLALSGLNHESTRRVGDDTAIEIEVTSNRPDCLGHIGVAREVSVLVRRPLRVPEPRPLEHGPPVTGSVTVTIAAAECCPFYSARVIRGVRVGPSPDWLVARLWTLGVTSVNNVVDVTNYVMFECGQPLHAFDLGRVAGGAIIVRRAAAGEEFEAINHKTYPLAPSMCVIADGRRPVAIAGVMGGADTEIRGDTTDVLLESAQFAPLAVRAAARGLSLSSASSYRFERGPDPAAVEWASRRAAELIMQVAGGTLDAGVVTAGRLELPAATIPLAPGRVGQVLGVDIPESRQREILVGLGFIEEPDAERAGRVRWRSPSWRRDVTREIDLVEEIARIEGYDRVPEDVPIAARPVEWSPREVAVRRAGEVLVAAGFFEALTRSVVAADAEATPSPWSDAAPLVISPPLVRGADRLRRTLLPSLLEARALNEAVGAPHGELFEVAHGYLAGSTDPALPVTEPLFVSAVTGGDFFRAKAFALAVLERLGVAAGTAVCRPLANALFTAGRAADIVLGSADDARRVGVVGEIAATVLERQAVSGPVAAFELRLDLLEAGVAADAPLVRPSEFPAVDRDVNLVVGAEVPWGDVERAIRAATGDLLEDCRLVEVWEDADRLGAGRKSFVVALRLRSSTGTLSGDETARVMEGVVAECGRRVGATLRG